MPESLEASILVINTGSSSLKLGLYVQQEGKEQILFDALADGIGQGSGRMQLRDAEGRVLRNELHAAATQHEALKQAVIWLKEFGQQTPVAIGHRVVHGGPNLTTHQRITPKLVEELKRCVHFAPLHIPIAIQLIEEAQKVFPEVPEFACFDTAFHTTMPESASRFPLPRELFGQGIRRYGFHGLSYESIVSQLGSELPKRTVIAHLGSGASLAAVRDGHSVDTSMGLTPTGGIPMATRTGDLDPGVLLFLLRTTHATADSLEELLNKDSGLKALSGGKADMRELEEAADHGDTKAQLAIEIFCARIRETVAAYAAVLGGIDLLVFTGGIGEHSARVRRNVCEGLGFLGVAFDDAKNTAHAPNISTRESGIRVAIVPAEEDLQIARHCRAMLPKAD